VPEHISRKELKQDKIKESFEHGAEAVLSHSQLTLIALVVILVGVIAYQGIRFYNDHKAAQASAAYAAATKLYTARIGSAPDPTDPNEPHYTDEASRSQAALQEFTAAADKYPSSYYGKISRYYEALCLEDLDRNNQALEELKKLSSSGDKEIAAMAQYQTAVIDSRTDKRDDAIKIYRSLADRSYTFVPRALVQLELAGLLRQNKPQEALTIYQQIKKDSPNTPIAEEADRQMETLPPAS
jgi:hypothetical protein